MRQQIGYLLVGAALALLLLGIGADVRSRGDLRRGLRDFPGGAGGKFAESALVVGLVAGVLLGWSRV